MNPRTGLIATARCDHLHQPCSWNESHTIEAHQTGLRSDPDISILSWAIATGVPLKIPS
jgi:hypothetical protein